MAEISKATILTCLEDDEHEPSSARNAPWAAAHASSAAARPSLRYWPFHAVSASLYGLPPPYEWPPASVFTSPISSVVSGLSSNANASPTISTSVRRRSYDRVFVSSDPAYYSAGPHSAPIASPTTENLNSSATHHVSCTSPDGNTRAPSCRQCTCQPLSGSASVLATHHSRRNQRYSILSSSSRPVSRAGKCFRLLLLTCGFF